MKIQQRNTKRKLCKEGTERFHLHLLAYIVFGKYTILAVTQLAGRVLKRLKPYAHQIAKSLEKLTQICNLFLLLFLSRPHCKNKPGLKGLKNFIFAVKFFQMTMIFGETVSRI